MAIIRPLGRLEKLSTIRHALGLYYNVIVTCQYTLQQERLSIESIESTLLQALARVVPQHAALCCSFVGESSERPMIHRCTSVHLKSHLSLHQVVPEDDLLRHLESNHEHSFDSIETRPGWRVLAFVQPPNQTPISTVVDIAFIFHHALIDGLSAVAFHKSLLQELRHVMREPRGSINLQTASLDIPNNVSLTPTLEDMIVFPISWLHLIRQILHAYNPRWLSHSSDPSWAGKAPQPLTKLPNNTRLRLISVPSIQLKALLSIIRARNTTLTCFITGAIVMALAKLLPNAERFVGATPYTMRRHTGTSFDEIVNQTSMFETAYEAGMLNELRARRAGDTIAGTEQVWKVAQYFQTQMKNALAQVPVDNPVGMLSYISNYRRFFEDKIGRPRAITFEISNLGVFAPPPPPPSPDAKGIPPSIPEVGESEVNGPDWEIANMLFSQGTAVVGPALTISCASVRGGALNLVVTWQEGVVDVDVVDGLVGEFARIVDAVVA